MKRSGRSASGHLGISMRSHISSTSARIQALADAVAARRQAEYDLLKENARKQKDAHDKRERAAAKAQHNHDMAVLAAKKLTAVAEAKLNAIKRTILNEISSPSKHDEDTSATSRQSTETWVQD